MRFKYKAQSKTEGVKEGVIEAPDKLSAAKMIRDQGNIPLAISEDATKGFFSEKSLSFGGITLTEKIIFIKNLSGMLQAGLALSRALVVLEKQSVNPKLKEIINSLGENLNNGGTLSEGMTRYPKVFSNLFISMVKSGEESGTLYQSLLQVSDNFQKTYTLNKKIKGALMYPSIIFSAMILIGVLMLVFVVPTLTKTFADIGADLPASTQFIISVSDVITNHPILLIISFIILIMGSVFFAKLPQTKKYFDYIILRIPVIGNIVKETNLARTTRTLSSLLTSGVNLSRALEITKDVVQNMYYKNVIDIAILNIEKGQPLSLVFKSHTELYPIMVGEMMEVGEETGNLSSMLVDIANFYENEVDQQTKDLSTIIEPVIMVIIGAGVGFFAISMLSPMYSILDKIN